MKEKEEEVGEEKVKDLKYLQCSVAWETVLTFLVISHIVGNNHRVKTGSIVLNDTLLIRKYTNKS